jgi:hypothetical protein
VLLPPESVRARGVSDRFFNYGLKEKGEFITFYFFIESYHTRSMLCKYIGLHELMDTVSTYVELTLH